MANRTTKNGDDQMPTPEDDIRGARRNQDMILTPGEYVLITDKTKGEVSVFVGPAKQSLGGDDQPVIFDPKTGRFTSLDLTKAIQAFSTAAEGSYIVLDNPAEGDKRPNGSGKLSAPALRVGKKVNISGPAQFALWPGQNAKVIPGHNLRSNEFLVCRVHDEEAAKQNWNKAVMRTQSTEGTDAPAKASAKASTSDIPTAASLTMGKLFIVRGTEVSFYIPPTGIEVVPETVNGEERYARQAVTLERLEYCLLADQSGEKRYERGPAVVFPRPTETFVDAPIKSNPDKARAKKFRAQELTLNSGIHVRVIADYTDEFGSYKEGQELFITGKEQPVYFPREEHAIIKYGEQDVHYGIAIPAGEARYVLNRESGVISIVEGPQIFLADPRTQVVAQRALPPNLCELMYPNNAEAMEVNLTRLGMDEQDIMGAAGGGAAFLNSSYVRSSTENENYAATAAIATPPGGRRGVMIKGSSHALPGDSFDRKSKFTAPRSVILNTKYDGVVQTTLWTGYAMLLIRKSGERRIVQGPGTFMLEYDESPQVITLSTGKPKTTDQPLKTVFLQSTANMVSDIIEVETKDFCRLNVKLSYRVNFEGEPEKWFNVDNYVKFLCDHMRSRVRSAVQKFGIEEFYGNHTEILRDIILGKSPGKGEVRVGATFTENGMRIYDVEILNVAMQNADVEKLLVTAQKDAIQTTLVLATERRKLAYLQENEDIKRQVAETNATTRRAQMDLQADEAKRKLDLDLIIISSGSESELKRIASEAEAASARWANELAHEKAMAEVTALQLEVQAKADAQRLDVARQNMELELNKLQAQTEALTEKAKAISPDLIAALSTFGERAMVEKVAESMAPLSILGGGSVVDVLKKLLEGTVLAKQLESTEKAVAKKA